MSPEEELPAPGLSVRFIRKIMDVTSEIIGNVPSIAGQEEFEQITAANRKALTEKLLAEYPGMSVEVDAFSAATSSSLSSSRSLPTCGWSALLRSP